MAKYDNQTLELVKRLQNARLDIMKKQPFYAMMLMHMKFAIDISCKTAYTDGERIAFNPDFIDELSDSELEFVLLHEILHVVLHHCFRKQENYDLKAYDLACDIVVNSNILLSNKMRLETISLKDTGPAIHLTTEGKEGYLYSVEEVYDIILEEVQQAESDEEGDADLDLYNKLCGGTGGDSDGDAQHIKLCGGENGNSDGDAQFDDHSFWGQEEDDNQKQEWINRMVDATELLYRMEQNDSSKCAGNVPACVERMLKELKQPQTDWRTILIDFIQTEINDYSFAPPDRRFIENPFFLPDFNDEVEKVEDILFMIDTSGSMSDEMITQAFSEVRGAIEQFNGRLKGWLGFFDAQVVEPKPFESIEELEIIRPIGGGGTSFKVILDYVRQSNLEIVSVIILTDGYAPFPDEKEADNIPVLWVINNEEVEPPWGKVARIKI